MEFDNLVWSKILVLCDYQTVSNLRLCNKKLYKLSNKSFLIKAWEEKHVKRIYTGWGTDRSYFEGYLNKTQWIKHGKFVRQHLYNFRVSEPRVDKIETYKCGKKHGLIVDKSGGYRDHNIHIFYNKGNIYRIEKFHSGGELASIKYYKDSKICCGNHISFFDDGDYLGRKVRLCYYDPRCEKHYKEVFKLNDGGKEVGNIYNMNKHRRELEREKIIPW